MKPEKALAVLKGNAMPGWWEHDIPGIGLVKGNSFTRNSSIHLFPDRPIRLVVNQQALASRNKIVPLDGEGVFAATYKLAARNDRKMNANYGTQLAEEFVIGDIKPLHLIIDTIELQKPNFYTMSGREAVALLELSQEYAEQHSLKIVIDPEFIRQVNSIKKRWAGEEDDD